MGKDKDCACRTCTYARTATLDNGLYPMKWGGSTGETQIDNGRTGRDATRWWRAENIGPTLPGGKPYRRAFLLHRTRPGKGEDMLALVVDLRDKQLIGPHPPKRPAIQQPKTYSYAPNCEIKGCTERFDGW